MNAAVETLNRAADAWWTQVLHATWQGSLVAVMLLLVVWLGRRWSAQLRYGLLLIALAKFAIPPMLAMPTGLFSRLAPAVVPGGTAAAADGAAASARLDDAAAPPAGPSRGGLSWRGWLLLVHALGCVVAGGWIVAQLARVGRMSRCAGALTKGPLADHLARLSRKLHLRRRVRLLVSSEPAPPMAFGLLRPAVMMPASALSDLPSPQVKAILAHELAHHRRGDLWVNAFQIALAALWWFNPVFWLLGRVVRKTREDCCDDLLLSRRLTTGSGYCQALLHVASGLSRNAMVGGALGFAERLHPLGGRMRRIMDPRLHRSPRSLLLTLSLLMVLAGLLLPGLRSAPGAVKDEPAIPLPPAAAGAPAAGQGHGAPDAAFHEVVREGVQPAPPAPGLARPSAAALPVGTLVYPAAAGAGGWGLDYRWAYGPVPAHGHVQAAVPEARSGLGWAGAQACVQQARIQARALSPRVAPPSPEAWPALGSIGPLGQAAAPGAAGMDLAIDSAVNTQWQLKARPTFLAWRLDLDSSHGVPRLEEILPAAGSLGSEKHDFLPDPTGGEDIFIVLPQPGFQPGSTGGDGIFIVLPQPGFLVPSGIPQGLNHFDVDLQALVMTDIPAFVDMPGGRLEGRVFAPVPEPVSLWPLALGGLMLLRRGPACRRRGARRPA